MWLFEETKTCDQKDQNHSSYSKLVLSWQNQSDSSRKKNMSMYSSCLFTAIISSVTHQLPDVSFYGASMSRYPDGTMEVHPGYYIRAKLMSLSLNDSLY